MKDRNDSPTPIEPRRTAAISTGQFVSGSVFRLVREIRGSAYSVGDQFMLIDEEDCHSPNILKLGGLGETHFIDPRGRALKIQASDKNIDSIFEFVDKPHQEVIEEILEEPAPIKYITDAEFSRFREGLGDVLREISVVRATSGERGDRGVRGFQGVQGDKGDRGEKGDMGETGPQGLIGPRGERGEQGLKGETGERGERGERGIDGAKGDTGQRGDRGEKGERGERGPQGQKGEKGDIGSKGEKGDRGERGERGATGANGRNGTDGARGEKGERGERGTEGKRGKPGAKGAKGAKGDRGNTGESGILTAQFPLVYDAEKKDIRIDEERLDRILKKILSGKTVSPTDMGWLASTGGGGKVAIYWDGTKITPDVRGLDFKGAGIQSVTKKGGKVTITITGGGIGNTNFFYQQTPPTEGVTVGSRWMDSDNGQEYIYINDGNTEQWVQPSVSSMVSATVNTVVGITASTYAASELDYYIGISYGGQVTVTLPDAPAAGREVVVKDESGAAGYANRAITVVGSDGDKIDNQSSAVININNAALHFIYRNGWRII